MNRPALPSTPLHRSPNDSGTRLNPGQHLWKAPGRAAALHLRICYQGAPRAAERPVSRCEPRVGFRVAMALDRILGPLRGGHVVHGFTRRA